MIEIMPGAEQILVGNTVKDFAHPDFTCVLQNTCSAVYLE